MDKTTLKEVRKQERAVEALPWRNYSEKQKQQAVNDRTFLLSLLDEILGVEIDWCDGYLTVGDLADVRAILDKAMEQDDG